MKKIFASFLLIISLIGFLSVKAIESVNDYSDIWAEIVERFGNEQTWKEGGSLTSEEFNALVQQVIYNQKNSEILSILMLILNQLNSVENKIYPTSCKAIKSENSAASSGQYIIDPDGEGGLYPFSVFCDMETEGGGWTSIQYFSDLKFEQYFTSGDGWKWLPSDFSTVLTKEQILAIQAVSTEGRQTYVGDCCGVIHYNEYGYGYTWAFGFKFLNNDITSYGYQNYNTNISVLKDDCKYNDYVDRQTIFEIRDKRVPIINVISGDNGDVSANVSEKFGSKLTENPAWLR